MTQQQPGRFIVMEGIDGAGKTTQIQCLCRALAKAGVETVSTFEPTDGPVGSLIRKMLNGSIAVDQRTIASLFAADRTDHLVNPDTGIRALVDAGKVVVCDRYYFSSYAYHAQHMDMDWVIQANSLNAEILTPTATLFIDVDPDRCLDRIQRRGGTLEIYEKIDIMKAVRANYFKAFEKLKGQETVIVIDGSGTAEQVAERVWEQAAPLVLSNDGKP